MFIFAALFVASFILSYVLGPKTKIENAKAAGLNDVNFPRAKQGDPVPRIYGTVKFEGPNTIGQANFQAVPIKKKVKTGPFSSKKQTIGYKYKLGLDLAVCLGPDVVFQKMWFGKYLVWSGCLFGTGCVNSALINLPNLYGGQDKNGGVGGTVKFYAGCFDQPRDPYLAAKLDPNIPGYPGISHVVFEDFYWGNSPNILPISFEVSVITDSLGLSGIDGSNVMPNGFDVNPIEVLYDLYINDWGNLGIPGARIDKFQWIETAQAIWAENNGMSLVVANPSQGDDITKQILQQINALIYEDPQTGLMRIELNRQGYDINTIPTFGPKEILEIRNFTKKLWSETGNRIRVKFTDRDNSYAKDSIAVADDFANIRYQGKIRPIEVAMAGVYRAELANELAARELSNINVPLYQCEIILNRKATSLRPGQPFAINWPEYGIERLVLRARKFGLGTLDNGRISISCVQDEFSSQFTIMGPPTPTLNVTPDLSAGLVDVSLAMELPYFLHTKAGLTADPSANETSIAIFAKQPKEASQGYDAFLTRSAGLPIDPVQVAELAPYSTTAKLAAAITFTNGFSFGFMSWIDIEDFDGDLTLLKNDGADTNPQGGNMFVMGNEIFVYETFTDNLDGTYRLNNVHRGILDTGFANHSLGSKIWFVDGQEAFLDSEFNAQKLLRFNLLDVTATDKTPTLGSPYVEFETKRRLLRPARPSLLKLNGARTPFQSVPNSSSVTLSWLDRSKLDTDKIRWEDEPARPPEPGTTYQVVVRGEPGVSPVIISSAITATPYTFDLPVQFEGNCVIELYAGLGVVGSWAPAFMPLIITPTDGALTVDNSVTTIDDERIIF